MSEMVAMKYLVSVAVTLLALCVGAQGQVVVIVNKSVAVSSVDKNQVANVYLLDTKELGGVKLVVFDLKESTPTKIKFYAAIGQSPAALRKEWLKAKLTGGGTPPTAVLLEEDVVAKVAATPGAIAYVSAEKVNSSVKVIMRIN